MSTSNFQPGQIVKYAKPKNKGEKKLRFTVLEVTPEMFKWKAKPEMGVVPEKLTVEMICDMPLKPTESCFSNEYEIA